MPLFSWFLVPPVCRINSRVFILYTSFILFKHLIPSRKLGVILLCAQCQGVTLCSGIFLRGFASSVQKPFWGHLAFMFPSGRKHEIPTNFEVQKTNEALWPGDSGLPSFTCLRNGPSRLLRFKFSFLGQ